IRSCFSRLLPRGGGPTAGGASASAVGKTSSGGAQTTWTLRRDPCSVQHQLILRVSERPSAPAPCPGTPRLASRSRERARTSRLQPPHSLGWLVRIWKLLRKPLATASGRRNAAHPTVSDR